MAQLYNIFQRYSIYTMVFSRRETAILLIGDFLILAFSLWVAIALRNLALPAWGYFEAA